MAKKENSNYTPDFISNSTIMEVVKYKSKNAEFVGMKLMSHGDFKSMEKQKGFRYQEFMKGFSQYHIKKNYEK
jgi:hypothetical protein